MNINAIPASTEVRQSAKPKFLKGGDTAVMLCHGYTGYPGDMYYLGDRLHKEGFTVSIPRWPGHGTNGDDLIQTDWRYWLRRAIDAYIDLKSDYSTVYVAGLSMGGLITLILASRFSIPKIALAAPAITNWDRNIVLTPFLKNFVAKFVRGDYEPDTRSADHEFFSEEYWQYNWMAPAASLYKLQKIAIKQLSRISADTLTIISKKDAAVPPKAADIIENGIASSQKKRVVLEESPHVVVNDCEKEKVADEIIAWFKK
ncbi:MAG: alpha/beta hydrolase [Spirochaetia bacterium]